MDGRMEGDMTLWKDLIDIPDTFDSVDAGLLEVGLEELGDVEGVCDGSVAGHSHSPHYS